MSTTEKRKVKSIRIKPSITTKMGEIKNLLGRDTNYWSNPHLKKLGFWGKKQVSDADVLEIAINKLHSELMNN